MSAAKSSKPGVAKSPALGVTGKTAGFGSAAGNPRHGFEWARFAVAS